MTLCGGLADTGGGPGGGFGMLGEGTGLAPVNGEGGFTVGAPGVRALTGFGSMGGSFQFSPAFLGGGGGRSATLEKARFVG